jgi:hypothetical protein
VGRGGKKGRRREEEEGRRGGEGRGDEGRGISPQERIFPEKEASFLYTQPFMFSKCALLPPLSQYCRLSGRRCAALNDP